MLSTVADPRLAESDWMAKKQAAPKAAAKGNQEIILVYKADPQTAGAYKEWLAAFAAHVGAPVTITLDMALKEMAASRKFKAPPKRLGR